MAIQTKKNKMKKNKVSIMINLVFLIFLLTTFVLQYEYLVLTRIVSMLFAIVYLIMELKKPYFFTNKPIFILLGAGSILAVILSISYESALGTNIISKRSFLIPIFVFVLLGIMYNDLYDEREKN